MSERYEMKDNYDRFRYCPGTKEPHNLQPIKSKTPLGAGSRCTKCGTVVPDAVVHGGI